MHHILRLAAVPAPPRAGTIAHFPGFVIITRGLTGLYVFSQHALRITALLYRHACKKMLLNRHDPVFVLFLASSPRAALLLGPYELAEHS